MKICFLTHCFYPSKLRGGPTVSMTNLIKALDGFEDISVITTAYEMDGKMYSDVKPGHQKLFGADVCYLKENTMSAFWQELKRNDPDVIYVSSLFSWQYSVPALRFAKRYKKRLILAPRGELIPSALSQKHLFKKLFLTGLSVLGFFRKTEFHVTSVKEEKAVKEFRKNNKVWNISNLPATYEANAVQPIRKMPGELKIVMIGRIHPIKNFDVAIRLVSQLPGNVELDLYGNEEVTDYVETCKALAGKAPSNITVRFCGSIPHEEIARVIQQHHILLSPTQGENFGQAIVEALLNCRPVIISDQTPWRGLQEAGAGYDIALDRPELFSEALKTMADADEETYRKACENAGNYIRARLNTDQMVSHYKKMLLNE